MRDKALDAHFTAKWVAQQARNERFKPASEYVESIPTLTDAVPRYEAAINALCDSEGIPYPSYEYRFYALRRWRFDCAWPDSRCALEIDGGIWTQGRHTRGAGFIKDQEKRNAAVLQGWRVIHCTPQDIALGVSHIATIMTRAA